MRAPDASFALSFAKGFIGIWLQMLMVTGLGVMFSTFLNGSVAMLATLAELGWRILYQVHLRAFAGAAVRRWPDHDASVVSDSLGGVPLAGMFCAGELGPVGGRNFVHGFTASVVLISAP